MGLGAGAGRPDIPNHLMCGGHARRGRATIVLSRCHQQQKMQMTGDKPVGTGSISLLCLGVRMQTGRPTEVCLAGDDIVDMTAGCGVVGVVRPSPVRLT